MITVFTPTYNRAKLLKRCYDSLANQTDKNFEWLVIDDGSMDETKEMMSEISKKAEFKIIYVCQENGGKHRAFNRAVKICGTDFFLLLDSDDKLTKNAIEILNKKCKFLLEKDGISGIIGGQGDIDGIRKNNVKMPDLEFVSGLELYQKMGFKGDTLRLYKTLILKENLFPEIHGEKFIPENVVFDRIDQQYKMLVIHEILYFSEYQRTGMTNNISMLRVENPIGYAISLRSMAETALTLKKKVGCTILYILWTRRFHIKDSYKDYKNKFFYLLCCPIGIVFRIFKIPKFFFDMFKEVGND